MSWKVDISEIKWRLLKNILKFFDTPTARKILSREGIRPEKGKIIIKSKNRSNFDVLLKRSVLCY